MLNSEVGLLARRVTNELLRRNNNFEVGSRSLYQTPRAAETRSTTGENGTVPCSANPFNERIGWVLTVEPIMLEALKAWQNFVGAKQTHSVGHEYWTHARDPSAEKRNKAAAVGILLDSTCNFQLEWQLKDMARRCMAIRGTHSGRQLTLASIYSSNKGQD